MVRLAHAVKNKEQMHHQLGGVNVELLGPTTD